MGQQGINYFYTGVLGLNENNLKVFYDFNSGDSNHILSIPIGNSEHSGLINGNSGDFFGDLGSGNFYNKSVKIANSTGLFSNTATFIVTQEKTGQNGGTIFSNFEGNSFKSGYYFGINDANKFYWGYDNNNSPSIKTSLKNLSDKNAWALKLENNSVSFCYYNNNTLQLEKESWGINSATLLPSDQWYIGSGKNLKPYDHFIDNFIYIDRSISDSNLTRLFSGIWNDASGNFSQYLPYETGQITGYTNAITGITGILSTSQVFSGNFTGTSNVEVYSISGLTGTILEGGTELQFLQNLPQYCVGRDEQPIYWEKNVDIETTGITGFQRYLSGIRTINTVTPVYIEQNETGYLSSGITSLPLYNTGDPADLLTSGQTILTPDYPYLNSFGMKSVSYIGLPQTGYFESLSVTGNPLQTYYNKIAQYNFGQLNFQTDKAYNSGQVDVFLNGLIQSTGGYSITGDFFNASVQISGDYYISGRNIYFKDPVNSSHILLYDIFDSGDKQYFESGDYSSSGTLPLDVSSNLFFLTGRKLVSGVDYSGLNGFFAATDYIQSISGEIRSLEIRPNQNYLQNLTQSNRYNFSFGVDFLSGTTGINPDFEILSGIYDGDPSTIDYFSNPSGQFILESGIYGTGFIETETGNYIYPAYTGWQIYSGVETYDVRFNLYPEPPVDNWENGTEFLLGWQPSGLVGLMTGQTFLRDTSINWVNGVRVDRSKFLEHGSVDLLNGNQVLTNGTTGFFSNNTDFWN